ncbi:unnamed protein product, partial [Hapterophycus canaliculatus]
MRLRPEWKETDSRFAVESGIDDVLMAFSYAHDFSGDGGGASHDDVVCLRRHLDTWGYTARTVQERFGVGGVSRLPGPYYLRKSLDHK